MHTVSRTYPPASICFSGLAPAPGPGSVLRGFVLPHLSTPRALWCLWTCQTFPGKRAKAQGHVGWCFLGRLLLNEGNCRLSSLSLSTRSEGSAGSGRAPCHGAGAARPWGLEPFGKEATGKGTTVKS